MRPGSYCLLKTGSKRLAFWRQMPENFSDVCVPLIPGALRSRQLFACPPSLANLAAFRHSFYTCLRSYTDTVSDLRQIPSGWLRMCGQNCPSERPGNQVLNRRVLNRDGWTAELLRHRVGVLLGPILWLMGVTGLLCCPAWAQAPAAGITANPTAIDPGGSSTLTWTTQNCVTADLNGTPVSLNGSQVVSPTTTTAYRITCANSAGATDYGQVTVTVNGTSGPPTAGIAANPTSIASGGSSTLTWTSTNAVSGNLNGTSVPLNGSEVVSPTTTTAYRFTVTSSTGATDYGQVTVTVASTSGPPTVGITANPMSIASGGSSTLTWTSTNAVSADLNGTPVPLNGSEVVSPTATTAYRFTARNSSGTTDEGTVTVTVSSGNPDPSISGQWTPVQSWPFMAAHAHLLPNGEVLFWPSFELGNNPTLWNPATNAFSTPPVAAYNIFCSGHSLQPDGTLLVTGGHDGNSGYGYPYASIYDPVKDAWTQISNMSDARWYPTNTTLPNGDVLVVSGEITPGVYNRSRRYGIAPPADG